MTITNAKEVGRTSSPGYGRIRFKADYTGEPDINQIGEAQLKLGYHPAGYGGPYDVTFVDGTVSWTCSASCD